MKCKSIGYAYASSPIAVHMKQPKGCYFLALHDSTKPMHERDVLFAAVDLAAVAARAEDCPEPYGTYSLKLAQAS